MSQTPNSSDRTYLGFNPAKDYHDIIRYEGTWVLFEQKQSELNKRFSKKGLSIYDAGQWSLELEAIRRIIQLSLDKNIRLTLFINPYHYTYLESIRNAGYWNEFETFKKSLTHVVTQYGDNQVALWDFSLYSDYTVSAIPKKGVNIQGFQWFWEPAHYKSDLGEVMLSDMFGQNCIKTKAIGVKLNAINIDTHLAQQINHRSRLLQELHSSILSP